MDLSILQEQVRQRISGQLGDVGEISLLCPPKAVADDVTKLLIRDRQGKSVAVALCASPASPGLVARGVANAAHARERLGPGLAGHVPAPCVIDEIEGCSLAVLPYFQPLADSRWRWYLQRRQLRPRVLEWLYEVNQATVTPATEREMETDFLRCLTFVADSQLFTSAVRAAAARAAQRLESRAWVPAYVLAHNDFWKGNILLDLRDQPGKNGAKKSIGENFMIIDWAGARMKGYAIYDLVRLCQSFSVTASQLSRELHRYCQLLKCDLADAESHLLSSIGAIGLNLEHFPPDRYARSMEGCHQTLCRSIGRN